MTKAIICLIPGILNLFIGAFILLFVLPLGFLGASSERMINISFVVFGIWIFIVSVLLFPIGWRAANFFLSNSERNVWISYLLTAATVLLAALILDFIGFVLGLVIGNLRD